MTKFSLSAVEQPGSTVAPLFTHFAGPSSYRALECGWPKYFAQGWLYGLCCFAWKGGGEHTTDYQLACGDFTSSEESLNEICACGSWK
jgi:hypothetical protein